MGRGAPALPVPPQTSRVPCIYVPVFSDVGPANPGPENALALLNVEGVVGGSSRPQLLRSPPP